MELISSEGTHPNHPTIPSLSSTLFMFSSNVLTFPHLKRHPFEGIGAPEPLRYNWKGKFPWRYRKPCDKLSNLSQI
jgi:hypothetical protein